MRHHIYSRLCIIAFIAVLSCLLCLPKPSHATFTEQIAITSKAISLANTVTAYPPGLMSVHYNPAGLSELPEGKTFEQGFVIPWIRNTIKFEADEDFEGFFDTWGPQEGQIHDPVAGEEDTNSSGVMYLPIYDDTINFLVGPTAGLASRSEGSRWTFAIGNYVPFGGGFNFKSDSPVRWGGRTLYQQHLIYAAPAVSFQATPTLSLGMTVGMGQTAMGARVTQRSPNELVALTRTLGNATEKLYIPIVSDLTLPPPWFGGGVGPYDQVASFEFNVRDDFSPNYNLGLLWQPKEWFSFGATYQSPIEIEMSGGFTFNYSEIWQRFMAWNGSSPLTLMIAGMLDLPTTGVPFQTGTATVDLTLPQRLQAGFMLKPTKRLRLMLDLHWADWSVQEEQRIHMDQRIQLLRTVKLLGYTEGDQDLVIRNEFEDSIHASVGMEYQLTEKLALRGGYSYRPTSVQDHLRDVMANVFPDLHFFGAGVGLTLPNKHEIDVGLGFLYQPSNKIPNNTSDNLNSTDFFKPVYNPYAGLDVEQKFGLYMASLTMRMPFADFIEMQKELMHHQHEVIHKIVGLLNPFSSGHDEEGHEEHGDDHEENHEETE
ncbi:MAG: outer membrane protein transport protein [Desulfobacterales bacterium]|nr:outer membrane protein transport protein [Desulfobacterales bacterium]